MSVKVKRKLGERVLKLSNKLGLPRTTVEQVIKGYLEDLMVSAQNGEDIVIDGIMSIKLLRNSETGNITARGRVSPAFKSRVSGGLTSDEDVQAAVHEVEREGARAFLGGG